MAAFSDREPLSLIDSAKKCESHLNRLKKHAVDCKAKHAYSTKKRHLLDEVISDITNSIRGLRAWTAAVMKGRQTYDDTIIATFTKLFDTIESRTAEVKKILDHRLTLSPLDWHKSRHEGEDNGYIFSALKEISSTTGYLHNNVDTILRDSPDQERRQERIIEVVRGTPKSYHVFVKVLSQKTEEELREIRFGTMRVLWEEIPARLDLEGHVGNADDPGDGKVYCEQDVQKAASVLKAFYDAWHEATIQAKSANATAPEALRRVKKLTYMAKICLILHGMKQERLLDYICKGSKDDMHLPLNLATVESILDPQDAPHAATFVAEQYRAICRTWIDGQHINIPEEEPLPLEYLDKYGDGSYGTVTKNRDAFTGIYYARKEQISTEVGEHIRQEILRLKNLSHRHIVQFVKSYQRGNKYGILLMPAATTDLHKLLKRYSRNGFGYGTHVRRDQVTLKPIILTAFGCLSRGLAHIHGCNIRHKDIKPSNVLYEKALPSNPARFLWADFGLAYDSGHHPGNSKTRSKSRYSPRYAAPEIMEEVQARKSRRESDTDDSDDSDSDEEVSSRHSSSGQRNAIGHGRKSDIYSFGIVFLEILSYLSAEGSEQVIPGFEACMPIWNNIAATQKWAETQAQKFESKDPKDPLTFLFQLSSKMISYDPDARPSITAIVSNLQEASPAYFCTTCQQEPAQYDLEQAEIFIQNHGVDSYNDEGSKHEEDRLKDLHHVRREPGSNEEELPVTSRGLQHSYGETLPDAEDENNDDLISLVSQSFADSGYESLDNPELRDEADELTLLLLDDYQLHRLFAIIFRRGKAQERFVSKFRMLLRIFGTELKREALNASHEAAAGAAELAKLKASYVANKIQKRYIIEQTFDEKLGGNRTARVEAALLNYLESSQSHLDTVGADQYDYVSDSESSQDSDDDIKDKSTSDQLPKLSLDELRGFMVSSQAFSNLQNSLRRMVYPDPLIAISDTISSAYELCSRNDTAVFNVRLDIDRYLNSELRYQKSLYERDNLLGSVLTVSGTASKAFATTATNYMRWKWPKFDFGLLDIIEFTVKGQGSRPKESTRPYIRVEKPYGLSALKVIARGSLEELKAIAQQLAWITATFRTPLYGQTSYSEISLESMDNMSFDLFFLQLEAVRQRESACWLPLFMNGIIARGFPVPARHGQKGIEVPFSVMIGLANIMYPVFHEDGLYLRGVSKLLFPTAVSPDLKSVQWHLNTSPNKKTRLPHGTLPSEDTDRKWLRINDLERLASASRTFLGYCRAVEVHLGTQTSKESYEAVTFSGADDEAPGPGISPKSVTTGTPGMGIWSFQVNMDIVLPKGLYSTAEPGWYLDLVDLAKEERVIVYDNAKRSQRAWLLPTLGVALHMAHIWAVGKNLLTSLPYAAPHWDSAQASFNAIQEHSKDGLRDSMEDDKTYTLRDLIGRLLMSLDKLTETEAHARCEPGRAIKLQSSKLFGWDLLAIVQGKKIVKRKQLDLSEEWMILGADSLVLFCQNFGDIIRPASDVRMCDLGDLARRGQNYLTAPIKCLQTLSVERSGHTNTTCLRLANQAYWLPPGDDLFGDCTQCLKPCHGKFARCTKAPQQLFTRELSSQKACKPPPIEGAISFGKRKLQKSKPSMAEEYSWDHSPTPETSVTNAVVVDEISQTSQGAQTGALGVPEIQIASNAIADAAPPPEQDNCHLSPIITRESPNASVNDGDKTSLSSHSTHVDLSSSSGVASMSDFSAIKDPLHTIDIKGKSFFKRFGKLHKRRSEPRNESMKNGN